MGGSQTISTSGRICYGNRAGPKTKPWINDHHAHTHTFIMLCSLYSEDEDSERQNYVKSAFGSFEKHFVSD